MYNRFKLYSYDEASAHSQVLNTNELEYTMHLEIPRDMCKHLSLYNIQDITCGTPIDIEFIGVVKREHRKPWIEFPTNMLNTDIGFHMYKFSFVNTTISVDTSLYFAYNIQCDKPEKSYVYMDRSEGGSN